MGNLFKNHRYKRAVKAVDRFKKSGARRVYTKQPDCNIFACGILIGGYNNKALIGNRRYLGQQIRKTPNENYEPVNK